MRRSLVVVALASIVLADRLRAPARNKAKKGVLRTVLRRR
jgi:hypothetical protein